MSRTRKGSKGPGFDYMKRRAISLCTGVGRGTKKMTTRIERARAKHKLIHDSDHMAKRESI